MIEIIPTEGIAIMFRQHRKACVALFMLFLVSALPPWNPSCSAAIIPNGAARLLSALLDGGTIVSGDKTFTNFTYTFMGDMPSAGLVNVVPVVDNSNGNFGIEFQAGFIDTPTSIGASDAKIAYKVTAGPGRLISDAHMEGNPNLLGAAGSVSVTETFLPLGPQFTMQIYDEVNAQNVHTSQFVDNTVFTVPTASLNVQKDILAFAAPNDRSATISFIDQTFSQITIPEPASGLLVIGGILGIGFTRKRGLLKR